MNFNFCGSGTNAEDPWIHSEKCTRMCCINDVACLECRKLPSIVLLLAYVADHAAPGTSFNLLSSRQLQQILRDKESKLQAMRLEVHTLLYIIHLTNKSCVKILGLKCLYATLATSQDDSKWFLAAIGQYDVPRVNQLVKQCLKERVGINQILTWIEDSIAKIYRVKEYNQMDFDMAILCNHVGGCGLLYLMSK